MFMCKHPAEDFSFVYRLIWGVNLDGNPNTDKESIMKNIQQMRDFAEGYVIYLFIFFCISIQILNIFF